MKPISAFKFFLLTHFGKPACDRDVYKLVRKHKIQSILELGIGDGKRAETMIQVAQKYSVTDTIRYTGVDLFEATEGTQAKVSLKEMHRRLNALGVKAQLVPGTPEMAVARVANSHLRTDLILISGIHSPAELENCWKFFPRMLHAQSVVMLQPSLDSKFEELNRLDVEKRSQQGIQRSAQRSAPNDASTAAA